MCFKLNKFSLIVLGLLYGLNISLIECYPNNVDNVFNHQEQVPSDGFNDGIEYDDDDDEDDLKLSNNAASNCQINRNTDEARIENGDIPNCGTYTYMAAITHKELVETHKGLVETYKCSGAIVAPKFVLTAKHCLSFANLDKKKMRVIAGDQLKNVFDTTRIIRKVIKIYTNSYSNLSKTDNEKGQKPHENDIGLIEVEHSFILKQSSLSVVKISFDGVKADMRCTFAGWGPGLKNVSGPLTTTPMIVTDNTGANGMKTCFIASAYHNGVGVCMGDSGGPLIRDNKLVGINHGGQDNKCSRSVLFTDIALYRKWLSKYLKDLE